MKPEKARIVMHGLGREITVLYNPTELTIEQSAHYAEHPVPGRSAPIMQFVRGEGRKLSLDLFLDRSDPRDTVSGRLEELRQLVRINGDLHAPPVVTFYWAETSFTGVVTTLQEKASLFNEEGSVLRARVSLSLREYISPIEETLAVKRESPDRTRVRVLREGETLAHIAQEAYGDPRLWTVIAEANGIDRPRFIPPGTALQVPAI